MLKIIAMPSEFRSKTLSPKAFSLKCLTVEMTLVTSIELVVSSCSLGFNEMTRGMRRE